MKPEKTEVVDQLLRKLLEESAQDALISIVIRTTTLHDDDIEELKQFPVLQDQVNGSDKTFTASLTKKDILELASKNCVLLIALPQLYHLSS